MLGTGKTRRDETQRIVSSTNGNRCLQISLLTQSIKLTCMEQYFRSQTLEHSWNHKQASLFCRMWGPRNSLNRLVSRCHVDCPCLSVEIQMVELIHDRWILHLNCLCTRTPDHQFSGVFVCQDTYGFFVWMDRVPQHLNEESSRVFAKRNTQHMNHLSEICV